MLVSLISLTLFAQFPGGSPNDLCAYLAAETKRPVVVIKTTSSKIGPFEYDPADLNSISRALRSKVKLELTPGVNLIVNDGRIPISLLNVSNREPFSAPKWVLPKVEDDTITFSTESNERIDPAQLTEVKFSKPLVVHWFYAQVPVAISAYRMTEREFLTYVAKGIGARFSENAKEFRIDFDPAVMRNRMIKTIGIFKELWLKQLDQDAEQNALSTGRADFAIGVLQDISLADLTKSFATPDSKIPLRLRSNGAAFRNGTSMLHAYVMQTSKDSGVLKTPAGDFVLPLRIDPQKPVTASFSAKFASSLRMSVIDANGKSMGELGFEFDSLEY